MLDLDSSAQVSALIQFQQNFSYILCIAKWHPSCSPLLPNTIESMPISVHFHPRQHPSADAAKKLCWTVSGSLFNTVLAKFSVSAGNILLLFLLAQLISEMYSAVQLNFKGSGLNKKIQTFSIGLFPLWSGRFMFYRKQECKLSDQISIVRDNFWSLSRLWRAMLFMFWELHIKSAFACKSALVLFPVHLKTSPNIFYSSLWLKKYRLFLKLLYDVNPAHYIIYSEHRTFVFFGILKKIMFTTHNCK